jgi:hypothetical protein
MSNLQERLNKIFDKSKGDMIQEALNSGNLTVALQIASAEVKIK